MTKFTKLDVYLTSLRAGLAEAGRAAGCEPVFGLETTPAGMVEYRPVHWFQDEDYARTRRLFVVKGWHRGRGVGKRDYEEIDAAAAAVSWGEGLVASPAPVLPVQVGPYPGFKLVGNRLVPAERKVTREEMARTPPAAEAPRCANCGAGDGACVCLDETVPTEPAAAPAPAAVFRKVKPKGKRAVHVPLADGDPREGDLWVKNPDTGRYEPYAAAEAPPAA